MRAVNERQHESTARREEARRLTPPKQLPTRALRHALHELDPALELLVMRDLPLHPLLNRRAWVRLLFPRGGEDDVSAWVFGRFVIDPETDYGAV